MNLTPQHVEEMIRSLGFKLTPQRRAIVDYLASAAHHPTAEEIFTDVNDRFPRTSRATVYNTLRLLKGAALVQEIFEDGAARFDPNLSRHHHFICRACGRVEDVDGGSVIPPAASFLGDGQVVEEVEVTFRGLCTGCAAARNG